MASLPSARSASAVNGTSCTENFRAMLPWKSQRNLPTADSYWRWYVGCTRDLPRETQTRASTHRGRSLEVFSMTVAIESLSDVELLNRMFSHDETGWREFCRRYDRLIWRCITKVTTRFGNV